MWTPMIDRYLVSCDADCEVNVVPVRTKTFGIPASQVLILGMVARILRKNPNCDHTQARTRWLNGLYLHRALPELRAPLS